MPSSREVLRLGPLPLVSLAPFVWKGTRLIPSPAALKAAAPGTSFMISNRYPTYIENETYPLPGGEMNWFMSTAQANDPNVDNYIQQGSSSATVPDSFKQAIYTALLSQNTPQLTVFIHGLGNLFKDAIWGMSSLGANLAAFANYPGLVIGFDWPSYDENVSSAYYASNGYPYYFPPVATSGTIRDNINGSRPAFANLLSFLTTLRDCINGLTVSVVCHSEGNYMAELGLLHNTTSYFDHVLMLAADVNDAVLQTPDSNDPLVGQGNGIVQSATDVTVYFTGNDDVLPLSLYWWEYDYHNPEFGGRLGSAGPTYNAGSQPANVYSVDCSGVINVQNFKYLQQKKIIPTYSDGGSLSMHSSYLFIPQVVQDMAALITGTGPGGIANRVATANAGGYFMKLNNSNNQGAGEAEVAVATGGLG
jgi:esterase/lipase superfamily enzyme